MLVVREAFEVTESTSVDAVLLFRLKKPMLAVGSYASAIMDRGGGGGNFKPWIEGRPCVKSFGEFIASREHICDKRVYEEDKADDDTAAGGATATCYACGVRQD